MHERRIHTRLSSKVVFGIETATRKDRAGISKDVSVGGTLLYTISSFDVGERVQMWCRDPRDEDKRIEVGGTIVRTAKEDRPVVLRHLAAVRFDKPVPVFSN